MLNSLQHPERVLAGHSDAVQRLRLQLDRVAPHFRTAVLLGEPGCLKRAVAQALQARSPLRDHSFHAHDAGSLPEDALERDAPATLYIARIGKLGPSQQASVLARLRQVGRAGQPELRLICSSDVAPRGLVAAGKLSAEFYSCINAIEIRVPPLRERLDDMPDLLEGVGLHPLALEGLCSHHWPGNLRELHAVLDESKARAGDATISPEHLPAFPSGQTDEHELKLDAVLRRHVATVLEGCAGNKLRAAEMLGISRSTLYRMLETTQA